jgi:hypothetical protein
MEVYTLEKESAGSIFGLKNNNLLIFVSTV